MRGFLLFSLLIWLLACPASVLAQKKKGAKPKPTVAVPKRAITHADSLVLQARALVDKQQEAAALHKCQQALHDNPVQYEALWRASVLSSRIGGRYTDETRRASYFEDARAYAARALEIHSDFATANYAMALAVANLGTLSTLRGRLAARLEEKPYLDAALRDEPRHADALQLLARWQFKVAHYSIFEKLASRLLVGEAPTAATAVQAMQSLEQAIEINPSRIDYYYDLARMHQLQGQRNRAIEVLLLAEAVELVTTEDLAIRRQCADLLEKLQRRARPDPPEPRPR